MGRVARLVGEGREVMRGYWTRGGFSMWSSWVAWRRDVVQVTRETAAEWGSMGKGMMDGEFAWDDDGSMMVSVEMLERMRGWGETMMPCRQWVWERWQRWVWGLCLLISKHRDEGVLVQEPLSEVRIKRECPIVDADGRDGAGVLSSGSLCGEQAHQNG